MFECHRQNPLVKCHFSNYSLQGSKCREGDKNCKSVWFYVVIKILIKIQLFFQIPAARWRGRKSLDVNMGKGSSLAGYGREQAACSWSSVPPDIPGCCWSLGSGCLSLVTAALTQPAVFQVLAFIIPQLSPPAGTPHESSSPSEIRVNGAEQLMVLNSLFFLSPGNPDWVEMCNLHHIFSFSCIWSYMI